MSSKADILDDYHKAEEMAAHMIRAGIPRHKVDWFIRTATEWTAHRLEQQARQEVGL